MLQLLCNRLRLLQSSSKRESNFKVFKNALAQFIPNRPPKHLITGTTRIIGWNLFDVFMISFWNFRLKLESMYYSITKLATFCFDNLFWNKIFFIRKILINFVEIENFFHRFKFITQRVVAVISLYALWGFLRCD